MKILDYLIREELQNNNWDEAVHALALNFNLSLPDVFRLDVMRDPYFISEIELYFYGTVYCWQKNKSFFTRACKSSTVVVADIYTT